MTGPNITATRLGARIGPRLGAALSGNGGRERTEETRKERCRFCRTPRIQRGFDSTPRGVSGLLSLWSGSFAFIYRCSPPLSSPQSTRGSPLSHLRHLQPLHHRNPTKWSSLKKLIQNGARVSRRPSVFAWRGPGGWPDRGPWSRLSLTRCSAD